MTEAITSSDQPGGGFLGAAAGGLLTGVLMPLFPPLLAGTIAGALLALDNALDLDLTSFLYPGWQGSVAVGPAMRRTN